ncbi:hypothetical protein PAXRUDRAFT_827491 [Paxillus rubicundulus Ve08.2h10]|uniref:Uncharacterized protein n=1 Tax=Paxillus rubicundulus Ve08.2h10 TaxID=930991 RepID=A0A0D0DQS9_9AGAM|nr:hypothetical protein PAXRUDRAFT_827491 [Paxillus rubicundulus Ve08.2h10]
MIPIPHRVAWFLHLEVFVQIIETHLLLLFAERIAITAAVQSIFSWESTRYDGKILVFGECPGPHPLPVLLPA